MKTLLFTMVLAFCAVFTNLNAQLENTIWYMGSANGVTFTPPFYTKTANTHNALGLEGCGVATNPITGVLMFYTDGIHLYNANNVSMPNEPALGLGGCPSAAQSVVFCKVPGKCLQYYVFVNGTGFGCTNNDLSVYLVDMTLNGGLGDIVPISSWDTPPPSNALNNAISESMTLVPISGTDEFWLVGKINTLAQMYAYKIDANFQANFTNPPITSNVGISSASSWNMEYSAARPITQNVAIAYPNNATGFIYTLGFDPANGSFTNPILLVSNINGQAYDVEWSATGNYLYYTAYSNFQQVDRWDFINNVPQSLFLSASAGIQGGGLKTGPDGIIYFFNNRNGGTLASITNADSPNPVYNPAAFSLPVGLTWQSITLPYTLVPGQISVTENHTMCPGESLTFTETGGASYVWYNQSGITSSSASITVSPTTNTFYTVAIVAADGCVTYKKHIVTIVSCACVGDSPAAFEIGQNGLVGLSYNNGLILINQDVTLSASVAFTNCEIKLAAGVEMTVPNGLDLKITNSHLYACNSMWDGIVVQGGGSINIESTGTVKTSLIEDAKTAVKYTGTLATETLNPVISITNTVFNRNHTAIAIGTYKPNVANYNITIENNLFTCRDIPFTQNTWTQNNPAILLLGNIKSAYNPIVGSVLDDQYIDEAIYSSTNPRAYLKTPMAGAKSFYGISLINVGLTSNEFTTTPTYRNAQIGRLVNNDLTKFNLFDNLAVGISINRANVTVIRNIFQNSIITPVPNLSPSTRGIGILALTSKAAKNNISVVNSEFINCHRGANLSNYFDVNVNNCILRSTQDESQNYVGEHIGKYGLFIQTNQYRLIDLNQNKLYNTENALVFNSLFGAYQVGTALDANAQYSGQVNITNNRIQADFTGYVLTTQYVRNAIIANNVFGATGTLNNLAGSTLNISNNLIGKVNKGIEVANWRKNISIQSNNCTLKQSVTPGFEHSGILFNNNLNTTTTDNVITDNSITGYGLTDINTYGIKYGISTNSNVYCNTTTNTYRGLSFSGASFGTVSKRNKLSVHRYGFVLDGTGTSIGIQGGNVATNRPADNEFIGNWTGNFMTATMNGANPFGNQMWVHNAAPYNPNLSSTFVPLSTTAFSTSNSTILYSSLPTGQIQNCPNVNMFVNNGDKVLIEQEHLRKHVNGEIPYELFPVETGYNVRKQIYQLLESDPNLSNGDVLLSDFVAANQASNHGKLKSIEHLLSQGNLTDAQNELATLESNDIDEHFKLMDEIFLTYATDTLDAGDSLNLIVLGNMCPVLDGSMVYQARAMYGAIYGYDYQFTDGCPRDGGSKGMMQQQTQMENLGLDLIIYPNPSSGKFYIKFDELTINTVIQVLDMQGRTIAFEQKEINPNFYEIEIDAEHGIYNIQIINSNSIENVKVKVNK